ncbi:septum formation family protein [Actinoplanes sp. CA-142083]|uniref:DUF4190 domain-containing protein n=1 Tax=Actinoplanes sp. CA-142083 TaxID=3239903 RepID=UPI003D8EB129
MPDEPTSAPPPDPTASPAAEAPPTAQTQPAAQAPPAVPPQAQPAVQPPSAAPSPWAAPTPPSDPTGLPVAPPVAPYPAAYPPPPPGYAIAYPAPPGYPPPAYPAYPAPPGYLPAPGYLVAPYGQPPPPPPDPDGSWNGFAIASLVFGFIGGVLFSVAFGITALIQLRQSRQRGRGLAIGGLALSGVWVLVVISLIAVAVVRGASSDTTAGSSTGGGSTSTGGSDPAAIAATGYSPGDCVDDIDDYDTMRKVSCTPAHDGEVFAVFDLPNRPWPGESEVSDEADDRCNTYLGHYVEQPYAFEYFSYYPSEDMWPGDRSVICIAYDQEGPLFGSIHH